MPNIEGIEQEGIFTLWNIADTDKIKSHIENKKPKTAAVIGGGFVGLEMAENLHAAGLDITLVEMLDQVLPTLDKEMARLIEDNMVLNGVSLKLNDGVVKFEKAGDGINITLKSGEILKADMVILSIGIRPNNILAKKAGLVLGVRGGVTVNRYLETSVKDIYAVGDVIEVEEFVFGESAMIPLAGPANRQARICADNIAGRNEEYTGSQGTSIVKIFDLTAASTGLGEKNLEKLGKKYGQDYKTVMISQKNHAGYYPGASSMVLKLIFNDEGKIFGAQIVGQQGVDKRIDVIAAIMRQGGDIYSLKEFEQAYAPPFSSAKDPVNMLGFCAENILKGMVDFLRYDELDENGIYLGGEDYTVLDVGEEAERMLFYIEDSVHIPLGQIRKRMDELDKNKLIIVYCAIGVRSYNAARILMQSGFEKVKVYAGGSSFFRALNYKTRQQEKTENVKRQEDNMSEIKKSITLDCSGLQCPGPIMKVYEKLKEMEDGDILEVSATDFGFARDVESWCLRTGNTFIKSEKRDNQVVAYIRKGTDKKDENEAMVIKDTLQGKTIIIFSGDLDKVIAAFIIANGAAAMGRKVTLFFTFWGLNVLRKSKRQRVKKPFLDAMFGKMMPRGISRLTISKMNMLGMGTKMIKKVMRDKNVDSLEDLVKKAMDNGVKMIACTMSMDIMGITKEELIDGIDYAGVATYLADAEGSNVNLFI